MIISVDKGTTYTKTHNVIFKSTIRKYEENEVNFSQNKIIVEYNNQKYVIGEEGKTNTNLFKSHQAETKLLILTAIALSCSTQTIIEVNLITGLPIGRYGDEKQHLKKLLRNTRNSIIVNNKSHFIIINDVEIFPEGASSFYNDNLSNGLIIDIGGLSVDVALFENKRELTKYSTHKLGIMPLYRQIANNLNNRYSLALDEWDIEDKIKNGLFIDGERVDLNIEHIINNYVQKIIQALQFEYEISAIKNIYLTGGGSILLHPFIQKTIPRVKLMNNSQYTNVNTYQILGEVLFNEEG